MFAKMMFSMMHERQLLVRVATATLLAGTALSDKFSYEKMGDDWADTVQGASLCNTGKEQSPIDLDLGTIMVSDMMEINGYGYSDFQIESSQMTLPTFTCTVSQGEFILNLQNGKKQLFIPDSFHLHVPSEHTVNGEHY